jgi:hypothetical protein
MFVVDRGDLGFGIWDLGFGLILTSNKYSSNLSRIKFALSNPRLGGKPRYVTTPKSDDK